MNVASDQHNRFTGCEYLLALSFAWRAALKIELAFDLFKLIEILYCFRRADFQSDKGISVRRLSDLSKLHAIRAARNNIQVLDYFVQAGKLLFCPDSKLSELFRTRVLLGFRHHGP